MPVLIPDIFRDPMAYLRAEALLRSLFDRIKCEDYQGPMWTQWMSNTSLNGTRFYDDSTPIYTQICEERRKGIKVWLVIPQDVRSSDQAFHALMDPCGEHGEIDALDISCVLTDENLAKADELIRLYMVDDRAPEAMTLHIEAMLPNGEGRDRAKRPLALASLDYGLRKHFCVLRGITGEGIASYDAAPKPGYVFNASMRFTKSGSNKTIAVTASAKADGDKVHLSYEMTGPNRQSAKGPEAATSLDCDAPDDALIVEDWLSAIGPFAMDALSPMP